MSAVFNSNQYNCVYFQRRILNYSLQLHHTVTNSLEHRLSNLTHSATHSHPKPDACRSECFFTPSAYKIVQQICEGKYIDKADLLPESLQHLHVWQMTPHHRKTKAKSGRTPSIVSLLGLNALHLTSASSHSTTPTLRDLLA